MSSDESIQMDIEFQSNSEHSPDERIPYLELDPTNIMEKAF